MAQADAEVFLWLNGLVGRFPAFDALIEATVSDYLVPVAMALALLGLWFLGDDASTRERHQKAVLVAVTALGFASLMVLVVNAFYFRPRPFVDHEVSLLFYMPTDSSFPANPVAVTFAIAAGVWGLNKRLGAGLYCLAVIFAFSRVYAGVFYPLDVVAGGAIGIVAAYLASKLWALLEPVATLVIKLARTFYLA